MKGYVTNIEKDSLENENFRKVIYTAKHSQLVLMSLLPGENIGAEVHHLDQFLRVEKGTGKAILNGVEYPIEDGSSIVVPEGTEHNIINTGSEPMKLYTLYSPPNHLDGTVHRSKTDAMADEEEHFEGKTTEAE
jgi:mannose-6-phosphate isomerase-like protein (cupin superfamily)